jgi:YfiH family protein
LARDDFQIVFRNHLSLMEFRGLTRFPWLVHGFSLRYLDPARSPNLTRSPGKEFNLGFTPQARPRAVERNQRRFWKALDADAVPAALHQIHSAAVWEVSRARESSPGGPVASLEYRPAGSLPRGSADPGLTRASPTSGPSGPAPPPSRGPQDSRPGDALISVEPRILLSIRIADCLPALIADQRQRVVAAIHAGWRGALARVIEKTVGELRRVYGSRPDDLVAALGPAIGRCCYQVGEEVIDAFRGQFVESDSFFHKPTPEAKRQRSELRYTLMINTQALPGRRRERQGWHLDLVAAARAQLRAAGLRASAIHASQYCTACRPDLFFSHRREGGRAGRMMAAIGVRRGSD